MFGKLDALIVLSLDRHRIVFVTVTEHLTALWLAQQICEAAGSALREGKVNCSARTHRARHVVVPNSDNRPARDSFHVIAGDHEYSLN